MGNYTVFLLELSTLTFDTFLTLKGTWGFYLAHEILVTAQRPTSPFPFFGFQACVLDWDLASGLSIVCEIN